ncbi:MAG TPA: hypothetical protein VJV75_08935, partial [Candidatus Polarisedimenticolia bacterium]|nr:hypothetical protein [Candidatus Polarisedimenticolia bacterium]
MNSAWKARMGIFMVIAGGLAAMDRIEAQTCASGVCVKPPAACPAVSACAGGGGARTVTVTAHLADVDTGDCNLCLVPGPFPGTCLWSVQNAPDLALQLWFTDPANGGAGPFSTVAVTDENHLTLGQSLTSAPVVTTSGSYPSIPFQIRLDDIDQPWPISPLDAIPPPVNNPACLSADLTADDTIDLDGTPGLSVPGIDPDPETINLTFDTCFDRLSGDVPSGVFPNAAGQWDAGNNFRGLGPEGSLRYDVTSTGGFDGDLKITNVEIVQVLYGEPLVAGKITGLRVDYASTWDRNVCTTIEATIGQGPGNSMTDRECVCIPPCGSGTVMFFLGYDRPGTCFPGMLSPGPYMPSLELPPVTASATIDPPDATGARRWDVDPDCPNALCINGNNTRSASSTLPVIGVTPPPFNIQAVAMADRCFLPPPALAASAAAADDYLQDLFPVPEVPVVAPALPGTLTLLGACEAASPAALECIGVAGGVSGLQKLVGLVPTGWFDCADFGIGWGTGLSSGKLDTVGVLTEEGSAEGVAHELGHTYGLSEHGCSGIYPDELICRDEYLYGPGGDSFFVLGPTGYWFRRSPALPFPGQEMTEDINRNGALSPGEDITHFGFLDTARSIMGFSQLDGGYSDYGPAPSRWIGAWDYEPLLFRMAGMDPDPEILMIVGSVRDSGSDDLDGEHFLHLPTGYANAVLVPAATSGSRVIRIFDAASGGALLGEYSFEPETSDSNGDGLPDVIRALDGAPSGSTRFRFQFEYPAGARRVELWRREYSLSGTTTTLQDSVVFPSLDPTLVLVTPRYAAIV